MYASLMIHNRPEFSLISKFYLFNLIYPHSPRISTPSSQHYWRKSYGYELNYVQSCPLVGEMLRQIRNAAHLYKISQKSNQE